MPLGFVQDNQKPQTILIADLVISYSLDFLPKVDQRPWCRTHPRRVPYDHCKPVRPPSYTLDPDEIASKSAQLAYKKVIEMVDQTKAQREKDLTPGPGGMLDMAWFRCQADEGSVLYMGGRPAGEY